jgi:TolA-binding protein
MSHKEVEDRNVLQSGYAALNQQDYDGALARSDQFLRDNPNGGPGTPEALYLQGRVYEHRATTADSAGHLPEARADLQTARQTYEHALTLGPSDKIAALLHAGVANVAYFQEDYFTAMREWSAAYPGLTQPDARAWVLYRLGLCQQRLGRFEEADRSFADVRRQYPRSEPAQRAATRQGARAFYVAIGSYVDGKTADPVLAALQSQGFAATKVMQPNGRQAIQVGPAYNYDQAKALRVRLLPVYPAAVIEP